MLGVIAAVAVVGFVLRYREEIKEELVGGTVIREMPAGTVVQFRKKKLVINLEWNECVDLDVAVVPLDEEK